MISVIIPTRNEEKLLPVLLDQFTPELKVKFDIETIISDAGSADSTQNIARTRDTLVVTDTEPAKQNISRGRNLGAASAKGDILIFLDADSELKNTEVFFNEIIKEFKKPEVVAAAVHVVINPKQRKFIDFFGGLVLEITYLFNRYKKTGVARGNCQIVKTTAFKKVGGYNENFAAGEDFELYGRLQHLGRIVYLSKVFVYESPRRFRRWGYVKTFVLWYKNYHGIKNKNQAWSKIWERVD